METGIVQKIKPQLNVVKKSLMVFTLIVLGTVSVFSQTPIKPEFGDGSKENPYQIATLQNLHWITDDNSRWEYYYVQTADIDASSTAGWFGGKGFLPIAILGNVFTGSYNGQGHTIDGLHIKRKVAKFAGLFGRIADSAKIEGLGLTNVDIIGHDHVGGLVGTSQTQFIVRNCYTTGSVSGHSSVGGLVGEHYYSNISDCYSTCSVTFGDSLGSEHWSGGGLVGYASRATIRNSYATGSVNDIGMYLYHAGGLVGWAYRTPVENSFWDIQTSGQSTSYGGIGKTTKEMKDVETYTKKSFFVPSPWDFVNNPFDDVANENFWDIDNTEVINKGYPFLVYDVISVVENIPVEKQDFEIYPNPAKNKFKVQSIKFKVEDATIELYDFTGKKLLEKQISAGTENVEIDVSHLKNGVYFCKLKAGSLIQTNKMILNK